MNSGLPSPEPPSENTLTINISHEQLATLEELGFEDVVAVSPTRLQEGDYAYDVAMDWKWAKVFYQQFKRPYADTGSINNQKNTDNHIKFDIDEDQLETLQELYDEGVAFLSFPLVRSRENMPRNLSDTIFVDVHGVKTESPTLAYIHQEWDVIDGDDNIYLTNHKNVDYCIIPEETKLPKSMKTKGQSLAPGVHINLKESIETVHPKYVMTWEDLLTRLLSCDAGRVIRMKDDVGYYRNDEVQLPPVEATVFGGQDLPDEADWL